MCSLLVNVGTPVKCLRKASSSWAPRLTKNSERWFRGRLPGSQMGGRLNWGSGSGSPAAASGLSWGWVTRRLDRGQRLPSRRLRANGRGLSSCLPAPTSWQSSQPRAGLLEPVACIRAHRLARPPTLIRPGRGLRGGVRTGKTASQSTSSHLSPGVRQGASPRLARARCP